MAGNVLDRLIGWMDPRAGLQRHYMREMLSRAYEAASPRDKWKPRRSGASADADHFADAAKLRAKARALVQNVPYIRAGMDSMVAQVIGTGIVPRTVGDNADALNRLFDAWVDVCDADGRLDYYGMEAAAYRAMEQDGEVLVRLRPRYLSDGLPVPLQLQLLEIDWLDATKIGVVGSNKVINGIEYDVLGRKVAYWLWNQHPGDTTVSRGFRLQSSRVPASSIIHLYNPERPGQGRGFTRLAPVIARTRDLSLYEDAEQARKNLEARLSVLVSGDASQMVNPSSLGGTADASNAKQTGDLGQLASGSITQLPPGMTNLQVVEPKAAPGYSEYVKQQLHLIAAGCGWSYEMMTGDMTEVNFSSARVRQNDLRRQWEQIQWLTFVPKYVKPIHRAFVDAAVLMRTVTKPNYALRCSPPKWSYVDPAKEVTAELAGVAGGFTSISQVIRSHGEDPQEVFAELASDIEKLKGLGVLDVLFMLQKGRVMDDLATQASDDKQSPKAAKKQPA
jgi:lambda family phage portal protein